MKRPRLSLGLEASRATLDEEVCATIGRQLAAARQSRRQSLGDVAERLLLSPRQVQGMETAEHDAFYSAEFYVTALRKYHAFFDLDPTPIDQVLVPAEPSPAPPPSTLASASHVSRTTVLVGVAVLAVVAVGGWVVSLGLRDDGVVDEPASANLTLQHLVSHQLPMATVPVTLAAPAPSGSTARDGVTGGNFGHISVARTTWVFVRYQDNSTVERVLSPGSKLVLSGIPIYLAAGEAPGAEIVIVGQPIDPQQFNVNGQLRIGSAFLSAALRH